MPLRLVSDDEDDGDDDDDIDPDSDGEPEHIPLVPFIVPRYLRIGYPGAQWKRDTLFNGERGEIGLAWSIFKIFGTPTEENWPVSFSFRSCGTLNCRWRLYLWNMAHK